MFNNHIHSSLWLDEMVGWHHQFIGHESEQALGAGDGQRSLVGYSHWDHTESDRTEAT